MTKKRSPTLSKLIHEVQFFRGFLSNRMSQLGFEDNYPEELHPLVLELLSVAEKSDHLENLIYEYNLDKSDVRNYFVDLSRGFQYISDIYDLPKNIKLEIGEGIKFKRVHKNDLSKDEKVRVCQSGRNIDGLKFKFEISYEAISNDVYRNNSKTILIDGYGIESSSFAENIRTGIHEGAHLYRYQREEEHGEFASILLNDKDIRTDFLDNPNLNILVEKYGFNKEYLEKYHSMPHEIEAVVIEYEDVSILGLNTKYIELEKEAINAKEPQKDLNI